MRARTAAGRSVASWNSAAERGLAGAHAELAEAPGEEVPWPPGSHDAHQHGRERSDPEPGEAGLRTA